MLIRESRDQRLFDSYPKLFAVFHARHRLLTPRHPPCALSSLTTLIQRSRRSKPLRDIEQLLLLRSVCRLIDPCNDCSIFSSHTLTNYPPCNGTFKNNSEELRPRDTVPQWMARHRGATKSCKRCRLCADNIRTKDAIYPSTELSKINLPGPRGESRDSRR